MRAAMTPGIAQNPVVFRGRSHLYIHVIPVITYKDLPWFLPLRGRLMKDTVNRVKCVCVAENVKRELRRQS